MLTFRCIAVVYLHLVAKEGSVMTGKTKKSPIWSFFVIGEDSKYMECNACGQKVSHGGRIMKTFNTSNLVGHLKSKHREEYKEFEKLKAGEERPTTSAKPRQLTLQESDERVHVWDVNDPRAHRIHQRIADMISIQEDEKEISLSVAISLTSANYNHCTILYNHFSKCIRIST